MRLIRRIDIVATMFLLVGLVPVRSADDEEAGTIAIPHYDVDAICANVTGVPAARCIAVAQSAYDEARAAWPYLDDASRSVCISRVVHNTTGGLANSQPYVLLANCAVANLENLRRRETQVPRRFQP